MLTARAFTRRFLGDPTAVGAFIIVASLVAMVLSSPWLAPQNPYDPMQIDIMDSEMPPSWMPGGDPRFWLGTDPQGRGVLSTIMYGTGISLLIGVGAVAVQAFIGYRGGWIDAFLMRLADIQLSLSTLMLAIIALAVFSAAFGPETYADLAIFMLIIVIGVAEWPRYARTVRASVLAEKKKEYVDAARVIGLSPGTIMRRHILPNTLTPVLVISTIQVAEAIVTEAALSFLGLGMPVNRPSLGSLGPGSSSSFPARGGSRCFRRSC
jgi:peptide/nickel transport system permease protein